MSENMVNEEPRRELDHRVTDGIEVQLLWRASDDTVAVVVHEVFTGVRFELCVERGQALEAFHHPWAFASTLRCVGDAGPALAS